MLIRSICVGMLVFLPFHLSLAQNQPHQWTSLDGPYWANGIDVAVGDAAMSPGNRYLIGSDNTTRNIYRWNAIDGQWERPDLRSGAKKIISYRKDGSANGDWAFCAAFEDDIYRTINGGAEWNNLDFDGANDNFSSVEIVNWAQNPGQTVLVGTDFVDGQPSAYYTDDFGDTWLKLGATSDPLDNRDVYDIETLPDQETNPVITAGTANGIYKHSGAWGTEWAQVAFAGLEVRALESLDGWVDSESQVAAVNDNGTWKLYLTTDGWDTTPSEIKSGGQSFNKEPRDIAAIYWGGVNNKISCHVATTEGVYILHFSANDPGNATEIDLKNYPNENDPDYPMLRYDQNIACVDYFYRDTDDHDSVFVVATTPHNVYEIIEERDIIYENPTLAVTEIVTGTYKCNVVGVSFAENTEDSKKIFTVTENALVKKYDNAGWALTGLAFTGNGII